MAWLTKKRIVEVFLIGLMFAVMEFSTGTMFGKGNSLMYYIIPVFGWLFIWVIVFIIVNNLQRKGYMPGNTSSVSAY